MDTHTHEIEVNHAGPVTIIEITRPQVRNAINRVTALALKDAWLDFEANENARVGILTGGDEVFCAGADLAVYAGFGKGLPAGLQIEARFGLDTMKSGEPFAGSQEFVKGKGRKGQFHS